MVACADVIYLNYFSIREMVGFGGPREIWNRYLEMPAPL
jgi:hypothetical protein